MLVNAQFFRAFDYKKHVSLHANLQAIALVANRRIKIDIVL